MSQDVIEAVPATSESTGELAPDGRAAAADAVRELLAEEPAKKAVAPPSPEPPPPEPEPTEKASRQREAQRYARQAKREREQAQQIHAQVTKDRAELAKWREEQQAWEQALRRDPLKAISSRLNMSPEQLLGVYADGKASEVPPHVQAQLDELRSELERERTQRTERETALKKAEQQQGKERAILEDVNYVAGVGEREGAATKYRYFASLPKIEREMRARGMVEHAISLIRQGQDIDRRDILEALDHQAKEVHDSFKVSKLLAAAGLAPSQKPRPRAPSGRDGAAPAPNSPLTDADMRANAIAAVREMFDTEKH